MCGRHATACALALGAVVSAEIDVRSNVWRPVAISFLAAGHASQDRTVWDGVYTEAQAKRGEEAYKRSCGYCHRDDLAGGFFDDGTGRAPALAGSRAFDSSFEKRWSEHTVGDMLVDIGGKMPLQDPASLTVQAYADILSYLFAKNDVPAGAHELPADIEKLREIRITSRTAR